MAVSYCKRIGLFLAYTVFIFTLLEIGSRSYWAIKNRVPFFRPKEIIYKFYPELKSVKEAQIKKDDVYYDILFLGGSVLNNEWGNIEYLLRTRLENRTKRKVRIYNISQIAHTSLDSYNKYKRLTDKEFDLVLFYHGINEVTANNCPRSVFKADYSHFAWYDEIYLFEKHNEISFVVFPYTFQYILIKIVKKLGFFTYTPIHPPKREWLDYGEDIKSKDSFRKNLLGILDIANRKKENLLLMTFSFYIPEDYTLERFKAKSLDYGSHANEIELWGLPKNVAKALYEHNAVIKETPYFYKNNIFIDQDKLIPKNRQYFNDICHLTEEGCEKFVEDILEVIIERIR